MAFGLPTWRLALFAAAAVVAVVGTSLMWRAQNISSHNTPSNTRMEDYTIFLYWLVIAFQFLSAHVRDFFF